VALIALAVGLGVVYLVIEARPSRDPARILGPVAKPALAGFHADAVQNTLVVVPVDKTAEAVGFLDYEVVDAYVRGSGVFARGLGEVLRRVQNGNVQLYLTGVLTGVVVIAAALGFGR
jgi:NADH-quinone oxidoreductase subunit L